MVTGSLQVKNGTYYAVLSFFNKDKNKWDQKWKTTKIKNKKGNKKLAENKLKKILETFEKELGEEEKKKEEELKETPFSKRLKENKNKSFLKYLLESIEEFKNNIEVTTYDNWKQMYEGRITNFFTPYNELKKVMDQEVKRKTKYKKPVTIANITQFDLEDFFSWLYNCDLKSSTVKKYYTLFSLVFDRAIRQKIFTLDTNPMKDIKKPVVKPYIADFYTAKELKQLFEIAKGDVLEIPIIIAVHYGLRRSETLGLKWNAIDFENNTIIIKHTVTKVTGCGEKQVIVSKDLTKTSSGYRTMPLTEEVKKKLLEHKEKIKENKKLFGNTYIGKNPTRLKNSYHILKFNFSGIDTTTEETTMKGFRNKVASSIRLFVDKYGMDFVVNREDEAESILDNLIKAFNIQKAREKIYVIIDEYDHFANELLGFNTNQFKNLVSKNGKIRKWYEILKEGTETVVDRIFITGVAPITLDSLTSGFNISSDKTQNRDFNEMMGFTKQELINMMNELGIEKEEQEKILPMMKENYDGYKFALKAKEKIYNSNMCLYFLNNYIRYQEIPNQLIDINIASDYSKLGKMLDLCKGEEREKVIEKTVSGEGIISDITQKFNPAIEFTEKDLVSMLYYLGYLTIEDEVVEYPKLNIPNKVMKEMYSERY